MFSFHPQIFLLRAPFRSVRSCQQSIQVPRASLRPRVQELCGAPQQGHTHRVHHRQGGETGCGFETLHGQNDDDRL